MVLLHSGAPNAEHSAQSRAPQVPERVRNQTDEIGLFLLVHMYANLTAFSGRAAFDDYARYPRTVGEPFLPYAQRTVHCPGRPRTVR